MKYKSGDDIRIGDKVRLRDGTEGVVVFSIDDHEYLSGYLEADWSYLENGVMINFDKLGLVYYATCDDELELISRD